MQDPVEGTEVSTSPLLLELIREAIADVHLLRGRALLALIGIAIGTAAVIAMLHIGHTARVESMRRFQSLGIDRLSIVAVGTTTRLPAIPESFVHMLLQPSFGIASAAPIVSAGTTLHVGRQRIGATLIASNDQLFELAKADFARGRAI
ncbi:MAG: ABC transporter permease, partial [Bradyrhizobium sp.]|nr:ABC transporter permease [Bradyrhizobium sp.]